MNKLSTLLIIFSFIFNTSIMAQTGQKSGSISNSVNLRELALPSEVKNIGKTSGAIFYSPSIKGKVLIPVNFWGEIGKSGLHFIPIGTSILSGLSLAGGPRSTAELDTVKLTRLIDKKIKTFQFDLTDGGNNVVYDMKLKPGDTIFVSRDNFMSNRAYYTSLIGVISTILSTFIIYNQVKNLP